MELGNNGNIKGWTQFLLSNIIKCIFVYCFVHNSSYGIRFLTHFVLFSLNATVVLRLQIAGQLHSHKDPGEEERHENENEAHRGKQNAVQLCRSRSVCLVHNDESHAADEEQKSTGQALHDVLAVDAIRHECDLDLEHLVLIVLENVRPFENRKHLPVGSGHAHRLSIRRSVAPR